MVTDPWTVKGLEYSLSSMWVEITLLSITRATLFSDSFLSGYLLDLRAICTRVSDSKFEVIVHSNSRWVVGRNIFYALTHCSIYGLNKATTSESV